MGSGSRPRRSCRFRRNVGWGLPLLYLVFVLDVAISVFSVPLVRESRRGRREGWL